MAMSFRPRGGAARRGRPVNRPIYEDFKPTYEWKHEEGASILLYHLPGFLKEQIRIIAESKGLLRVRGERLVSNNKWSRFEEQVMVPEDCNMSEIRAKFEGGILRINMPKKATTLEKTQHIEEQPKTTTYQGPTKSHHHELQQELPPKPTNLPPINHLKQPNINQENIYDDADTKPKSFVQDQEDEEESLKGKYDEAIIHDEKYDDALDQENKESNYDLSKMNRFDNYKQGMKTRLSKKSLDEDRQLLVNMGVAILVIFALGASISYSFGSSG